MPKILDVAKFCEELEEVTSPRIFEKKNFHKQGLFSEQIFGPLKNYTCQCGTYHGASKSGGKCSTCGVEIVNSNVRRTRFAKISLPIAVVNPIMYDLLVELGGKMLKTALDDLMKDDQSVLYLDNDEYVVVKNKNNLPNGAQYWEGPEAIRILVEGLAKLFIAEGMTEWKIILDNIENLMISNVIVLPPDLRPASSVVDKERLDKINFFYILLLTKKKAIQKTTVDIRHDKRLYYYYFKQLQTIVNELYVNILQKLSHKKGLIRGNILGRRIDFSGRAVIVPDPTLTLEYCVLPYTMVLEIFKLPIAKRIIELGKFSLLNKALDFVDTCIRLDAPVLFNVAQEIVKDEYCIINRQPSLHRLGMLAFRIKVTLDKVIKIHPLICHPFNADFDGDQMAVYVPITQEAKDEAREKMMVVNHLFSPANKSLTTKLNQDIILGIYYLTSPMFPDQKDGFKLLNECFPDDYPEITETVDAKKLHRILDDLKEKYPREVLIDCLDKIKRIGFKYSTLMGCTMSLDDFAIPEKEKLVNEIYGHEEVRDQLIASNKPQVIDFLKEKFPYSFMIESGARGSWDQAKQMILTRGFVANFDGQILPTPIKNSLVDGLTPKEFFTSTYGCRKGLLDVAINTGSSGYLSRKLIFACANLQIDLSGKQDCGTKDTLEVHVDTELKARMLVDRYMVNEDGGLEKIDNDNWKELVGKTIQIRSPILCESEKICPTCYGDLYKYLNSRFIGIIAAQTLGERGTQLVLKTFHTSGSAIIKGEENVDMTQQDIIGDLASASRLLHQFDEKDYTQIVDDLFKVYNKDIHHVHIECVVSQLMWVGSRKWRTLPNRHEHTPTYHSIQSVPTKESWLLALAFANPRKAILQGIMNEGQYEGVLDMILRGEKIDNI